MRYTHENEVCTCEPVNRVRSCLRNAVFWMECICMNVTGGNYKYVRICDGTCELGILDVNRTSYLWTGPFTCERGHSLLDETRRLSVYKWRPHLHLTVYSHEKVQITRGGPRTANTQHVNGISMCDRVFHV